MELGEDKVSVETKLVSYYPGNYVVETRFSDDPGYYWRKQFDTEEEALKFIGLVDRKVQADDFEESE